MSQAPKPADSMAKVMDVSKPGRRAPDPSSRPLLVTQRTMAKDPMVKDDETAPEETKDSKPVKRIGIKIDLDGELKDLPTAEPKTASKTAAPTISNETESTSAVAEPAETAAPQPIKPSPGSSSAVVAAVAAAEPKRPEPPSNAEEIAKQEAIEKLIAAKQYHVPISTPKKQSAQNILIAILVFMLVAMLGVDLALDAGLIKSPVIAPFTNFFH